MKKRNVACSLLTWGARGFWKGLDEISSLGYKGVEYFAELSHEYGEKPQELQNILERKRLKLVSLYVAGDWADTIKGAAAVANGLDCAQFLKTLGAEILCVGGAPRRGATTPAELYAPIAQNLNALGRGCRELGLKASLHPHKDNIPENREELDRIMELTDPEAMFLCPDTAHLALGGADNEDVFRTYINRIAYVHLKDLCREEERTGKFPDFFLELGRGIVDFKPLIKILDDNNYNGWFTVELDRTKFTPAKSAEMSKRYLVEELGFDFG